MKKLWTMMIVFAMTVSLLLGCGGKTEEASKSKAETQEDSKKEAALDQGYWVVEQMVLEGSEFSSEDIEGIFGPLDAVGSFVFESDGTMKGVLFEEFLKGTYTGTVNEFSVEIEGEKMKGSSSEEGKLELTLGDGSKLILVNQKDMPEAMTKNPWTTYQVDFDSEATCAMSNFMNYGRYYIEDDVLYGLTHANGDQGQFGATPFYMKGDFPEFEEPTIIDPEGSAVYINKYEDYFYYLRDWAQVCRVHMDGSGLEVLYDGACDYLQVHDGKLYFTDEDYHYVSMNLDGSNVTTIIDKEIYYPYFICSDWMVFQDDADDESLHLYNTTIGTELNITYMPSFSPVIDGKYIFFTAMDDTGCYLCKIDMSNPEVFPCEVSDNYVMTTSFLIDETYIYTANNIKLEKEDWKNLSDTKEISMENEYYVSEKYTVYHYFDEEGLITGKYLMSKEKNGGTAFK